MHKIKRILIIDDDKQTCRMMERALKKFWPELEISSASDGIMAIQVAQEFLPDLVILDLMLPGQDGLAVLEHMNEDPSLKFTLILGITAYNSPENIRNLMKRGALNCLTKPFSPEDLKRMLLPYLGGSEREQNQIVNQERVDESKYSQNSLLNAAAFLSLMMSAFQVSGTVQAGPSHITKATKIEEPYKKGTLPFKRIAVLSFESWNEYLSGNTLSDYFVHYFIQMFPEITVVERKELQKILKEQLFSQTGAITSETAASIGKILGVDALVIGKITTLETIVGNKGAISIVYRIVDVNTGQVLWSDKQNAKMKPKLIQFEASYKSPTEVADLLLEQVAKKSISQLQSYFSDISRTRSPVSNL